MTKTSSGKTCSRTCGSEVEGGFASVRSSFEKRKNEKNSKIPATSLFQLVADSRKRGYLRILLAILTKTTHIDVESCLRAQATAAKTKGNLHDYATCPARRRKFAEVHASSPVVRDKGRKRLSNCIQCSQNGSPSRISTDRPSQPASQPENPPPPNS
jgi:hypothetical protein